MEYKNIGELCIVKGGKRLPKGTQLVESKTEHPYLRITDYSSGKIDFKKIKYITNETFETISKYVINEGDIFLSIVGTIGIVDIISRELDGASLTENAVKIINNKPDILNTRYLAYFLESTYGQHEINIRTVGSTQKKLAITRIKDIPIPLMNLKKQEKLSDIMRTLDSKIELNNQMIDTLEEMASTLFKRWFVDFEFPDENGNPYKSSGGKMIDSELGEIPEGWEVCCISEIIEKGTKKIEIDQLSLKNYVSTENLLPNKKGLTDAAKLPTQIKVNKFEENDILISNIRPYFKKIWYSDGIGGYSNDVLNFKSNKTVSSEYLYLFLKDDSFFNFMVATSKGTKMPRGDKKAIQNKELVIPCKSIDESFKAKIVNLLRKVKILNSQNTELGMLRDTLLPKLLTGEIEV